MRIKADKKAIQGIESFIGVYLFTSKSKPIYIGKSINVKARLLSHLENAKLDKKESLIVEKSDSIELIRTDSEFKALVLESKLIQTHHPHYNVRWRDNKSYLYIRINGKDSYPKLRFVRKEKEKAAQYFGPFPSTKSLEVILSEVRKIFPFCMQKQLSKSPCFYSKIGLCSPCPSAIEKIQDLIIQRQQKRLYRANIKNVIRILNGETELVKKKLYQELKILVKEDKYEDALILRDKIFRIEHLINQRLFNTENFQEYDNSSTSIKDLLILLGAFIPDLKALHRIECYDVSNTSQKLSTASMVVATEGRIDKAEYRKFRLKNPRSKSDFEMLEEAVSRRFRNKWQLPNLVVIDGGKPQIRKIQSVLKRDNPAIPIVGLAKNPDRLIIGVENLPTLRPRTNNAGFRLLQSLRDESHRFAKKYHVYLRAKKYSGIIEQ